MARSSSHTADTVATPVQQESPEPRLVFNGGTSGAQNSNALRSNRPAKPRKRSPLLLIGGIACVSILIVMYVWNKITVNRLKEEVEVLQMQIEKMKSTNKILVQEIDQKERLEVISRKARALGMISPVEPPVYFEVEPGILESARTQDAATK